MNTTHADLAKRERIQRERDFALADLETAKAASYRAAIEDAAKVLERAAEHYIAYAKKYSDGDGDQAETQSRTCQQEAAAIRAMLDERLAK